MSTRCQIEFRNITDNKTEKRTIYRHWDGYPEAVIPDLTKFLKWNHGRNCDIEYQSANFIYWSKKQLLELKSDEKLGFGICENDKPHGDIEFFYEIEYKNGTITIRAYAVNFDDISFKRDLKETIKVIII